MPRLDVLPQPVDPRLGSDETAQAGMPACLDGERVDGFVGVRGDDELGAKIDGARYRALAVAVEHDLIGGGRAVAALEHPLNERVFVRTASDEGDGVATGRSG